MSNPSQDQTSTFCLCLHPDNLLVPALTTVLEENGITVTSANQIPQNTNWLENISYLVWSWSPSLSSQAEIEIIVKEAVEKNRKLLCLIPLDIRYDFLEKQQQGHKEIADIISKINNASGGRGDVRIIAYAGLWGNKKINPVLSVDAISEQLQNGQTPACNNQALYPLNVTAAVQNIFSLWFDRGHRSKTTRLSGPKVTEGDIINNIDISGLIPNKSLGFWGRGEGISFFETKEVTTDTMVFFDYLKKNTVIKSTTPPAPAPSPSPARLFEPVIVSTVPREIRKIEIPTSPPTIKTIQPIVKRGLSKNEIKRPAIGLLVGILVLLLLNLPNLIIITQILLARTINLESKEVAIPNKYQQLATAKELVTNTTARFPLVGQVGDSLIAWADQEQNRLLMLKIQTALVRAAKHMVSASPGDPFETLQEARHSLNELYIRQSIQKDNPTQRKWVSDARKVVELLPLLIPPDKKITVLLLLQNNLELRPTGGFIGAVAILSFDHGKLLTLDTRDIYDLDSNLKGLVNPPDALKTYLGETSWYFRDSNWSPNFIESAASANWFLEKEWGSPADVVIGLNLNTFKTLLAATGPITLPNGTVVESNNLLATAFNHQDVPIAKPDTQKQEFLSQLVKPLIDNFIQASPEVAIRTLSALETAAGEGELTITSSQPTVLSELTDLGWSGQINPPTCTPTYPEPCALDTFAINEANVGINKTNFYVTRSLEHLVNLSAKVAKHTHRITYTNNSPNDTWPGGSYKAFIRIILPGNATGLIISADGQSINPTTAGNMSGFFLEVKPQTTSILVIDYAVTLPNSYASYELNLIKQPGVSSDPLTVAVTPPPSRSLQSLTPLLFPESVLKYSGSFSKNFSAAFTLTP